MSASASPKKKPRDTSIQSPTGRGSTGKAPSKTQIAYEYVKNQIITAAYRPGQYLNVAMICDETGLGRTPVHEALLRLSHSGFIDILPRKGAIVRPDSLNEVLEILEARWVMEPYCAGLAAERATAAQIQEMTEILEQSRRLVPERSFNEFMRMDGRFHGIVLAASGSKTLADLILSLHEKATRVWFLRVWEEGDLFRTQEEHEAILSAIKRGDHRGATTAMQRHITSLRRRVMSGKQEPDGTGHSPADPGDRSDG